MYDVLPPKPFSEPAVEYAEPPPAEDADKAERERQQEKLVQLRRWFQICDDAERPNRARELEDARFLVIDQWRPGTRAERENDGRPCLTFNRLQQSVRHVTNEQRQQRSAIQANPVDDAADVDTAEVAQGLIRHIEYDSNADVAWDTAVECSAATGVGYVRLVTEYCDPLSFDQSIKFKRIRNRFSVWMDPYAVEADRSDANYAFIGGFMDRATFRRYFPKSEIASMNDWTSLGDTAPGWATVDTIRVVECFYRVWEADELILLSNGETVRESKMEPKDWAALEREGITEKKRRATHLPSMKWCKTNGVEILEELDWAGDWIPIIPVLGDETEVDGQVFITGIVHHAKEAQRQYNFMATQATEMIGLMPKAPYIGAASQFEGYQEIWSTANTRPHAFLPYNPQGPMGEALPPPRREFGEPAVSAIVNAMAQAADDIKATTGIWDAAVGNQSNETSGRAISRRAAQSELANSHYAANLRRAQRHAGRIILNLLPHVYDTERVVRIIGEDGTQKTVQLNKTFMENGVERIIRFDVGKYDVTVSSGPSYASRRQEAAEAMTQLVTAYPPLMQVAPDLVIGMMDFAGAQPLTKRLKKTLPPELQEPEEDGEAPPIPPEIQKQMADYGDLIDKLTAKVNETNAAMASKDAEYRLKIEEIESKERIATMEAQTSLIETLIKVDSADAKVLLMAQVGAISKRLELLNNRKPIDDSEAPAPRPAIQPISPDVAPQGSQAPVVSLSRPGGASALDPAALSGLVAPGQYPEDAGRFGAAGESGYPEV